MQSPPSLDFLPFEKISHSLFLENQPAIILNQLYAGGLCNKSKEQRLHIPFRPRRGVPMPKDDNEDCGTIDVMWMM
jgi:hypothetical protein